MQQDIQQIAFRFIQTLQHRTSADELLEFYHTNVEQIEFPNTVTRNKTIRTLDDLKQASERGKKVMQKETYDIINPYTFDNKVILEVVWTATLAVTIGKIPVGGEMKAYFAQFYEFKDGKIFRQRNYDCFEPFT